MKLLSIFSKYRSNNQLEEIVVAMELKFMKYYKQIPLLYYFRVILDPIFKMTKLYNILRLMSRHMNYDYVDIHYTDVEERFKKVYKA